MPTKALKAGKLDITFLNRILDKLQIKDKRVKIGPKIGEDAAVIEMNDRYLIAASDPVTFVSDDIGYYAVHINANDIAVRGAVPKWFLATLLLPEKKSSKETVLKIFSQIEKASKKLNISLVGGHTEIVPGIDRPIVSGHMIGEVDKEMLIITGGAEKGNRLILTKGICIEGVSILAREKSKDLIKKGFSQNALTRARNFIYNPGISVVKEALLATKKEGVTCMHDPTEGGLAMGCYEIAKAADVGMVVYEEKIPVLKEAGIMCKEYSLNPLGTIASGSLLMTVKAVKTERVLSIFEKNSIRAEIIGEIRDKKDGVMLQGKERQKKMPYFTRDEITRIF